MQATTRTIGNNAAGRIFNVFTTLKKNAPQHSSILQAWYKTFEIEGLDLEDEHILSSLLRSMNLELKVVTSALDAHRVPTILVEPYMASLYQALSLVYLHQNRDSTIQFLDAPTMLSLHWYSHILPDEDLVPSDEVMESLKHQVAELEAALAQEGIPPAFRSYATALTESLKSAIRMFPIQGVAPIRSAVRQAVADAHFEEDALKAELEASNDQPQVQTLRSKLSAVLKTAATTTGDIEKVARGYGFLLGQANNAGQFIADAIVKTLS